MHAVEQQQNDTDLPRHVPSVPSSRHVVYIISVMEVVQPSSHLAFKELLLLLLQLLLLLLLLCLQ